uniref:Muscular LMNA interacting protein n=1 Tax=Elaeophora elaphi TaxID=1147741 RepID=A0A0R3RSC9_9BILA
MARQSWNLSMGELDRFFEQVRILNPLSVSADENTELFDDMSQRSSTFTQSSIRIAPQERIIPIRLIGQESTTALKDRNSSETPVIKRYVYDPGTMTHREYVMRAEEYPIGAAMISKHKAHETLINDIPYENRTMKKRLSSSDESGVLYVHMRNTPPPEYTTETVAVIHNPSDHGGKGKAVIQKRIPTAIDIESQQKALYPQYSKSAVQRQIARRTSSGSEYSKSYGKPSQAKNRPIKQTEQVIKRFEDGILSARNTIQSSDSQRLDDQRRRKYVTTPEMKRSKSPILMRLLTSKKKRRHPECPTDAQEQLDNSFEQPRAIEASTDQSLQSPLRSYGRLVRDDELEDQLQDGTIHLSEESATTAIIPRQKFRNFLFTSFFVLFFTILENERIITHF